MIGRRLSRLRKEKKLTQQELANKLGIARTTYAGYENESREPDNKTLQKIADFFDTTTDYLLGRSNNPSPHDSENNLDDVTPMQHLKAWLKNEGTDLTEEERKILAEELADYFEMRKRRILSRNRRNSGE